MKKILLTSLAALALASCVSDNDLNPVDQYGYINVKVNNDPMLETRTETTLTGAELSGWTLELYEDEKKVDGATAADGVFSVSLEKEYTVHAHSYTGEKKVLYTDYGKPYHEGTSEPVTVSTKGEEKTVDIDCGKPANSKITASFPTREEIIKDCKIVLNTTNTDAVDYRKNGLTLSTSQENSLSAFYEAGSKVKFQLTYTLDGKSHTIPGDGNTSTNYEITTGKSQEHIIAISTSDHGKLTVSIKTNDKFDSGTKKEITINAATGDVESVKESTPTVPGT